MAKQGSWHSREDGKAGGLAGHDKLQSAAVIASPDLFQSGVFKGLERGFLFPQLELRYAPAAE
jgi:hypothetical protein